MLTVEEAHTIVAAHIAPEAIDPEVFEDADYFHFGGVYVRGAGRPPGEPTYLVDKRTGALIPLAGAFVAEWVERLEAMTPVRDWSPDELLSGTFAETRNPRACRTETQC